MLHTGMLREQQLPEPIQVSASDRVAIRFEYDAGAPLSALQDSLDVRNTLAEPAGRHRQLDRGRALDSRRDTAANSRSTAPSRRQMVQRKPIAIAQTAE